MQAKREESSRQPRAASPWRLPPVAESWQWPEDRLAQWQLDALNKQFRCILPSNEFYRRKLGEDSLQLNSLHELKDLPFTTKGELVAAAQQSPHGISPHHSFPLAEYTRLHRTSGTTGDPLLILDTEQDWVAWWSGTWQHVLHAAGVDATDRVFLAFSFGPFIGFWSAHQACIERGALVISGGGMSSMARLEFMRRTQATVVCCTPSYALHLAQLAENEGFPLGQLPVRTIIVAGESGGSVPAVRQRMETAWQAHVVDHSGATEIGPWGFGWPDRIGLHVIETSFIAEFLPVDRQGADAATGLHELVLTSIGRLGAPLIRYRTGDVVEFARPTDGPCRFVWLPRGVVGRADDMVTIRGVNVFPSSIDAIVRQFPQIAEYRVRIHRRGMLDELRIEIEGTEADRSGLERALLMRLGLRIPVHVVASGTLPRFEAKARRWIDERQ
ncbi:MAG: coenzyme F390 synthetase [Pirellulaceae bacterium]|nr:MAG: coenzyme F390 synthetase [Pirellulaceae bacterium]